MLISNSFLRWMLRPCAATLAAAARCRVSSETFRFMPPSWRPSPFQTCGQLEQWRTSLLSLGIKLAAVSICSFACKALLVALQFCRVLRDGGSVDFSLSTILVEALPSLLTIMLLTRYHTASATLASGVGLGTFLLTRREATDAGRGDELLQ